MDINKIKTIVESYTKNFSITEDNNCFIIKLDEKFHNTFKDDMNTAMNLFINETTQKKLASKLKHNIIIVSKDNLLSESEYKGRNVTLNKPMKGDVKKYKVFVNNPETGNIKKVNFGDKNMEIKRDDPERKKSFRSRHNCADAKDKTTPRYWSCKFWSNKSVTDLLSEVIEPDNVDVSSLPIKNELNPLIWGEDNKLHDDVRNILLKNIIEFIKYSNLENIKYKDIILTGSIANYNWSEHSDLDLHVLFDFNQISDDKEFVSDYFREKKRNWNEKIDQVRVKGFPVELYAQDTSEDHSSTGVYSIYKNEWSTQPQKTTVNLDIPAIQLKTSHYMNEIDELSSIENPRIANEEADKLMDRLGEYRKAGLQSDGEYSVENLVFKLLRRSGYLEKISEIKKNNLTQDLTLENLSEGGLNDKFKKGAVGLGMVVALLAANHSINDLKRAGISAELINQAKEWVNSGVKAYFGK